MLRVRASSPSRHSPVLAPRKQQRFLNILKGSTIRGTVLHVAIAVNPIASDLQ